MSNKKVLINVEDKDIRVAVLVNGILDQLFVEQLEEKTIVGNIYKGRVDSIVPGLQAVFVDIGMERNAFLHFADVNRNYILPGKGAKTQHSKPGSAANNTPAPAETAPEIPGDLSGDNNDAAEASGENPETQDAPETPRPAPKPAARELKPGDEILVQSTKETMGTKGARVTTYISLPGRYLVLLPFSGQSGGGVSRRIEDFSERKRLRSLLRSLKADEGSFIIRTAGLEQEENEIANDVQRLTKTWARIRHSSAQRPAPALIYDDHDILGRLVRDELTTDVEEILIDSRHHGAVLKQIIAATMPSIKDKVTICDNLEESLFEKYDVESQFQKALRRKVWLRSGGYIIIDETEALIAIDVNTGKFVGKGDQEATIYQTNLEAAEAVARQLRLRDIGGIIVVDFIDMKSRENQNNLVRKFKEYLKHDRAKTTVSTISEYGLMQMTRKRVRQSLAKTIFNLCPYCQGSARVLSEQQIWKSIKYEILRLAKTNPSAKTVRIIVHPLMRVYIEDELLEAAKAVSNFAGVALEILEDQSFHFEHYETSSIK